MSVDCSGITFMDPAGYHALVDATNYATRRSHTLVIRNMSPPCARFIQLYN
jgi:anti-anti-sigma regulatory factor